LKITSIICSPDWVGDLVVVLERIYENPVYTEDHPNPYREFEQLEEIVEVSLYSKSYNITSIRCLIMICFGVYDLRQGAAVTRWADIVNVTYNKQDDDLTNLLNLADKLAKELSSVAKKFKTPIME
jgi:aspartate/methionine/tyrosine aminotransferase